MTTTTIEGQNYTFEVHVEGYFNSGLEKALFTVKATNKITGWRSSINNLNALQSQLASLEGKQMPEDWQDSSHWEMSKQEAEEKLNLVRGMIEDAFSLEILERALREDESIS
jgi:hypothetical protein